MKNITPEHYYEKKVTSGEINDDPKQRNALKKLNQIHNLLKGYKPRKGITRFFFSKKQPCGIYMYGSVGNGKSLLLRVFYESAPTNKKIYMHFNDFLLDINYRMKQQSSKESDPLKKVANDILKENWLLCLDECSVGDVGDAILFGRIVNYIIQGGGVMICTSNFTPEKLTPRGGGSSIFKPYIEKFFEKTIPYDMDSVIDYRAKAGADKFPYYLHPLTPENAGKLQRFIDDFSDFSELKELKVEIRGHNLHLYQAGSDVCYTTYQDLMGSAYGVEDFNYIAENFKIVVMSGMKKIPSEDTATVKRFILLVDSLYEKRRRLIMSAQVSAEKLYTGKKVQFEYKRTLSRLKEMQSPKYS
ncbi:MAG: cell division protein ZapE [Alphaproteobacteria bacterium]